jgi:hypothetical protein
VPAPDPWTAFLQFLQTLVSPNWGELISMMPLFIVAGVLGPIITLVMLLWVGYLLHRRRGRVRIAEPEAMPAPLDANGEPVFAPNVPFCETHALIYPATATICEGDGSELSVSCPIDHTVRVASQQVCRACGTRYVLGAARTALTVRRTGRPPEGGAAIA